MDGKDGAVSVIGTTHRNLEFQGFESLPKLNSLIGSLGSGRLVVSLFGQFQQRKPVFHIARQIIPHAYLIAQDRQVAHDCLGAIGIIPDVSAGGFFLQPVYLSGFSR